MCSLATYTSARTAQAILFTFFFAHIIIKVALCKAAGVYFVHFAFCTDISQLYLWQVVSVAGRHMSHARTEGEIFENNGTKCGKVWAEEAVEYTYIYI